MKAYEQATERPRPRLQLYVAALLMMASTVSWRQGVYFSGALDPVVVVKALLSLIALGLAAQAAQSVAHRRSVGPRSLLFLFSYLVLSCLGGWAAGTPVPSFVVAFRVALLAITLVVLLTTYEVDEIVAAFITAIGLTALVAVVTGVESISSGRLEGGFPLISPNELAFLCGAVMLFLLNKMISSAPRRWYGPLIVVLLTVIWLTGSRTGLVTLVVAVVVLLLQARRLPVSLFVSVVSAIPILAFVLLSTSVVTQVASRGGTANVTTLSSRTIAWSAALNLHDNWWQQWFGGGLSMKHVPVSGQYWSQQILDSSWLSALVQGGVLGLVIVAAWTVSVAISAWRGPLDRRALWTALLVFIVARSFLESGLFDASTTFIAFALISLTSEPAVRDTGDDRVHADQSVPSPVR